MLRRLSKTLVLPPVSCFALVAIGFALRRRRPRAGRLLMVLGIGSLWLLATPYVGIALLRSLQVDPPVELAAVRQTQAIVVLSADLSRESPEYGGPSLGRLALERVRYGALLQRATHLPLLVTGGTLDPALGDHATAMARVLRDELGVPVRWLEQRARNTWENARYSAELLHEQGIERVTVVTHAWHMPRARYSFECAGLRVTAAPTGFTGWPGFWLFGLLPSWSALRNSCWALHEWLGLLWYHTAQR